MNTLTLPQVLERINALEESMESVRISATELRQWKEAVQSAMKMEAMPAAFPPYNADNLPDRGHIVRTVDTTEAIEGIASGAKGIVCERSGAPWIHTDESIQSVLSVPQFGIPAGHAACVSMYKLQRIA